MPLYGWDCSHFDAPDTRHAVSEGFSFFTHKAGGDALDPELNAWWNYMRPYGLAAEGGTVLLGAYWVLYPGNPAARADAFLARLDSQCPGWRDGPFILQADCEKWNGNPATVPSLAEIQTFCDRLHSAMPKLVPIVYAPAWVYGNNLRGLSYPLWSSRYVSGSGTASGLYPGDTSAYWASYSGIVPAVLQFTSSATIAGQTTCDANAFRGSLAELTALLAPGWDDMITNADVDVILARDAIINPKQRNGAGGPTTSWGFAAADTWQRVYDLRDAVAALSATVTAQGKILSQILPAIQALTAGLPGVVDEAALKDMLVQAITPLLPGSNISTQQLEDAFYGVMQRAFTPAPEPTPAPSAADRPETLADIDSRTERARHARQPHIQGGESQ